MKKTVLTFIIGLIALVFFESFDLKILAKQQDGSNPGFTGSPGDSLRNCTACHGGTAITQANWIKSVLLHPKKNMKIFPPQKSGQQRRICRLHHNLCRRPVSLRASQ